MKKLFCGIIHKFDSTSVFFIETNKLVLLISNLSPKKIMQISDFSSQLRAMKAHYKGFPLTRYALPIGIVEEKLKYSLEGDYNDDYNEVMKESNTIITTYVESQQNVILQEAQTLGTQPTGQQIDDFKKKLAEQKENAKKQANEKIDQIFDKLEGVGINHPEFQGALLAATEKIISFFSDTLGKLIDFISDLVQKIYEFLKNVVKNVKNFFESVLEGVSTFFGVLSSPLTYQRKINDSPDQNSLLWNSRNTKIHQQLFELFCSDKPANVLIDNNDEVEEWKKLLVGDRSLENTSLLDEKDKVVAVKIVMIAAGVTVFAIGTFASLAGYALYRGYKVKAKIESGANKVEIEFKPN